MSAPTAQGWIRPYEPTLVLLGRAVDAIWIIVALRLAVHLRGLGWTDLYTVAATIGAALFLILAERTYVYREWRGTRLRDELLSGAKAWLYTALLLLLVAFVAKRAEDYSRIVIISWFVLAPSLVSLWRTVLRLALRGLRRRGRNTRTVAVAGAGALGTRLVQSMLANAWTGLRPIGFFDDDRPVGYRPPGGDGVPVLGTLDAMVSKVREGELDRVYIALPMRAERRARELIGELADTTASVFFVPDVFAFDLLQARVTSFAGIPAISVFETPFTTTTGWVKRLEDIVLATLFLLVVALPMLVIALGVKLSSKGCVFFRQRRYGLDGREIAVWKFRTMTVCEEGAEVVQARRADPRVTRFGSFLRRHSLDELPQFFNVLAGTMSIVGPRPHAVAHNEQYRKLIHGYMLRHRVKPGITGWAQINGCRGETARLEKMQRRVEHDLWYIRNWSILLDLKIVAVSVVKGFVAENAY